MRRKIDEKESSCYSSFNNDDKLKEAIEYIQEHYCNGFLDIPYMLLGDIAELIEILIGKDLDYNELLKYIKR